MILRYLISLVFVFSSTLFASFFKSRAIWPKASLIMKRNSMGDRIEQARCGLQISQKLFLDIARETENVNIQIVEPSATEKLSGRPAFKLTAKLNSAS